MKNIIVYEKEFFDIIDTLSLKLDNKKFKYICFEKIKDINLSSEKFDNYYFFVREELCFVSSTFFDFLKYYNENKFNFEMKIIFILENVIKVNSLSNWLDNIKNIYKINAEIVFEMPNLKWKNEIFNLIDFISQSNKSISEKQIFNIPNDLSKKIVTIYTDGACSGNPGAGGWGAVLISGERKKEFSGFDPLTTNNKMELTAVIKALSKLKQKCNVELFSDSAYVVNAINERWLENWKKNNYVGSDKKPIKNIELWKELESLLTLHNVTFNKVKGHSDNNFNNRCDELATGEIAKNVQTED